MNIFAAAADYMSWASLLGIKPGDAPITGNFDQNTFYLNSRSTELKIPVSGETVFIKMGLAGQTNTDYNSQFYYSYGDKFFTVYDVNGKLRVSLERIAPNVPSDGIAKYRWKTWHPDTGAVINTGDMWAGIAFASWNSFMFEITTTAIKFYISGILINTLDITGLSITGFSNVGFGPQTQWSAYPTGWTRILYMVVSDTVDYSLRAYPYKPKTLDAGNQFTGTIDTLNSWLPDRSYMSSAAEYNVKCSFSLEVPATGYYTPAMLRPDLTSEKIIYIDQYIAARYVQAGGVSANFRIHNTIVGGPVDYTFVCPANEDDTKTIFRKLPTNIAGTDLPSPVNNVVEIYLEA